MHYTIFSCSPQSRNKSTSAFIAEKIKQGITDNSKDTADILYLNHKKNWGECRTLFYESKNIIFCIPLYVEGIPGLLMEFLETLGKKKENNTKLSFILQGGFEEASQLRTAEQFLKTLPGYLNCGYGGTLVKGGLFGMVSIRSKKFKDLIASRFIAVTSDFKEENKFKDCVCKDFAGREYYSKGMIILSKATKPLNRLLWSCLGRKMGAKAPLSDKPYLEYMNKFLR